MRYREIAQRCMWRADERDAVRFARARVAHGHLDQRTELEHILHLGPQVRGVGEWGDPRVRGVGEYDHQRECTQDMGVDMEQSFHLGECHRNAHGTWAWTWSRVFTFESATYSPCCSLTRSFLRSMICNDPLGVTWPMSPAMHGAGAGGAGQSERLCGVTH